MSADDLIAIGVWLATIAAMVALAWKPFRLTRNRPSVKLDGPRGQPVSPLSVFSPAAILAALPFISQLSPRPGVNVWLHPHLMLPFGFIPLAVFLVAQFGVRVSFLVAIAKGRKDGERKLKALAGN